MNESRTINVIVKSNGKDISKAFKKIKGLKGGFIALTIFCGYLAAELAERKRSENYLKAEIDELKEKVDSLEGNLMLVSQDLDTIEDMIGFKKPKATKDGGDTDA